MLWYAGMTLCIAIALWSVNYVLFLTMESARTYANLPAIQQRYYAMLIVLAASVVGTIACFVKARRTKPKSG